MPILSLQKLKDNPKEVLANLTIPQLQSLLEQLRSLGVDRRVSVSDNPADFAAIVSQGKWQHSTHLDLLASWLRDLEQGTKKRIMVSMPPRHGKSELISYWYPLWLLTRKPTRQIILASYEAEFAAKWGRRVRNAIQQYGPELKLTLDTRSTAGHDWQLMEGGGMFTTGVGGPLTGRGADCFPAGTIVATETGPIDISTLYQLESRPRVLSMTPQGKLEYRQVLATRRRLINELVEVTTSSGRTLRATPEHRIWSESSYRKAALLLPGDGLTGLKESKQQDLPAVPEAQGRAWSNLSSMLHDYTTGSRPASLFVLPRKVLADALRVCKELQARTSGFLLFSSVLNAAPRNKEQTEMYCLRSSLPQEDDAVLQQSLQAKPEDAKSNFLWDLWNFVRSNLFSDNLLWEDLCRQGPQQAYAGIGQLQIQSWNELQRAISKTKTTNSRAGWKRLCGLLGLGLNNQEEASYPPHRSGSEEQSIGEPDHSLPDMPCPTPQVCGDSVSLVQTLRPGSVEVYDIQVEGNHNFFANGVLVHNCLIIDDPIKNAEEASSETIREKMWDWFQTTAFTRIEPGGWCVIVATRWHQDDLIGRLESASFSGGVDWEVIKLPALAEKADPLGRLEGQALWPERFNEESLELIKKGNTAYNWSALYQQRPSPEEGGGVKRAWWNYYESLPSDFDMLIQSWDLAFKDLKSSDYCVGQVWGRKGVQFYLLYQIRQRMNAAETISAIRHMTKLYPKAIAKIVEDRANGPAVISMLQNEVAGMIPWPPKGKKYPSKDARLQSVLPLIEAKNCFLPGKRLLDGTLGPAHRWVDEFIEECAAFPNGTNDDQLDACTQALMYFQPQSWMTYNRAMKEAKEGPEPKSGEEVLQRKFSKNYKSVLKKSDAKHNNQISILRPRRIRAW